MTPERYEQVRKIFLAAREKGRAEREEFLRAACGKDEQLRKEVESLLGSDETANSFMQTPALGLSFAVGNPESLAGPKTGPVHIPPGTDDAELKTMPPGHPRRVGQYRILGILGQGGMGVVYRAEQESPRRTVALKVIRPGVESRETLKRFAHESQVLGWLQHPGIAQIYEAGTHSPSPTEGEGRGEGQLEPRPYFAMEYVSGLPLAKYAHEHHLGIRERLELLTKVCDAVHHAHQKGVIHRDLKPGNILVTGAGQPKILDFGVARATDADIRTTTLQTAVGQLVGTIAYMSPEQVGGDPRQLDTRSDVYSLGVIGFELLTGRTPVDVAEKTLPQAARAIVEEEPTSLGSINRVFRGDIQTIISKALEKDKTRRYQSANDLAEDIRRYLEDQPISARPATTLYHLRKFARRNKPLVAGVLLALAALVAGIVGTTWQAVVATRERNRAKDAEQLADRRRVEAERQSAIAQAVNDFLNNDLLGAARPEEKGRDVSVRQVLDIAAEGVEERFPDTPLVEAAIQWTLAESYLRLGEYKLAEPHFERALALRRGQLGEEHPDTLESMNGLAVLYRRQNRLTEAEALCVKALEIARRALGKDDPAALNGMMSLASLYSAQGRYDAAEPLLIEALEGRRRVLGEEHPHTLTSLNNLAALYGRQGRSAEAEPLLVTLLEVQQRLSGEKHPKTLLCMNNLASVYRNLGRLDEAGALHRQTLDTRREVLGPEHPDTLLSMHNLVLVLQQQKRFAEAEPLCREALAAFRRVLGNDHINTLAAMHKLAVTLGKLDKFEEAAELATEYHERAQAAFGPTHAYVRDALTLLADLYDRWGKPDEAATWRARLPTTQPTPAGNGGEGGAPASQPKP